MIESKVKKMIFMGGINEHAEDSSIARFINKNGLVDIHEYVNELESNELDNVCKCRTKCINTVMRTHRLIKHRAGYQMLQCNKQILNDHRGYLKDIEIKRY